MWGLGVLTALCKENSTDGTELIFHETAESPAPLSSSSELESLREELELVKRRLCTVTEEHDREVSQLNNDLANLLSSTPIPMFLFDGQLQAQRITPLAKKMLGIDSIDTGVSIWDVQRQLGIPNVEQTVRQAIELREMKELELQDSDGHWLIVQVHPFQKPDHQVDGAVVVLTNIDQLRSARIDAHVAREFAEAVIESGTTPLVVLRDDCEIRLANRAFYETFGGQPADIQNQNFFKINSEQWNLPELRVAVEKVLEDRIASLELELEAAITKQEPRTLCINIRLVHPSDRKRILIAIEDITARKLAEKIVLEEQKRLQSSVAVSVAELKEANQVLQSEISGREQVETALHESETALLQSREELRHLSASLLNAQDAERRRVSRELHDDLSQKMAKLQFDVEILQQKVPFADIEHARLGLRKVVKQAAALSNDLRRVAHQLHPATLDHLGLAVALRSYAEEYSRSTAIRVKFIGIQVPREIPIEVASGMYRIAQEALRNVGKHSSNAEVEIVLAKTSAGLALFVRDTGEGFDIDSVRAKGGLGLISMQERVRLLDGIFSLETKPGKGVLISIQCPVVWGK